MPTLARICGAELPNSLVLDGLDATEILCGEKCAESHSERTLHAVYGLNKKRLESFRYGSWKLHFTQPPHLYDLANDLGEIQDRASERPEIVGRLTRLAREIRERVLTGN